MGAQVQRFLQREIPLDAMLVVAGDFNDWGHWVSVAMAQAGLVNAMLRSTPTYPSRLPLVQLDHIYVRGLRPVAAQVPRGTAWARMSDHLPLIAEFEMAAVGPAI